jgi:L-threonylcarbamoyladenylate synthase
VTRPTVEGRDAPLAAPEDDSRAGPIDAAIDAAARVLRDGGLVAFPTETVYGLGADAASTAAVRRLYAVKGRPPGHPVIVHLGDPAQLGDYGRDLSPDARALAAACWPGPLTVVVRREPSRVCAAATGGLDTVGLRVPAHPIALALLRAFGGGVAAPSANRYGRVSPTTAAHVRADLGDDVGVVLDGGASAVGVESTIVDCTGATPRVLRPGGVPAARLAEVLGRAVPVATEDEGPAAPGRHAVHYAPAARVVVIGHIEEAPAACAAALAAGERVGLLALDAPPRGLPTGVEVLPAPADVADYAHVLYGRLRDADRRALDVVVAVAPGTAGLGAAIEDRLRRAAAR